MTGPKPDPRDVETRPISVAELLAKNGSIGSPPVTGRRRRRRGNADAVTVAELTGEIPIIRDDDPPPGQDAPGEPAEGAETTPDSADSEPSGGLPIGPAPGFVDEDRPATAPRPAERDDRPSTGPRPAAQRPAPEPRWPKSSLQPPRATGPQPSPYPRPMRRSDPPAADTGRPAAENGRPDAEPSTDSDAERMRPDPVDTYTDLEVDVMDTDVRDADLSVDDSAYVRSYLSNAGTAERAGLGPDLDEPAGVDEFAEPDDAAGSETADQGDEYVGRPGVIGGALVVLQSILAVALGGGLFIAFDQLWRWNSIVALVLTGLVTLGLVAAVQAVRKTVDIVSTLIAVAVGLLVTLGPLALHAN